MINGKLHIKNSSTIPDGGTQFLIGFDSDGKEVSVLIAQYFIEEYFEPSIIPARLHFNDEAIEIRSKEESDILRFLKESIIKGGSDDISYKLAYEKIKDLTDLGTALELGPEYGTTYLVKLMIEFVQSDYYLELAKKFSSKNYQHSPIENKTGY